MGSDWWNLIHFVGFFHFHGSLVVNIFDGSKTPNVAEVQCLRQYQFCLLDDNIASKISTKKVRHSSYVSL